MIYILVKFVVFMACVKNSRVICECFEKIKDAKNNYNLLSGSKHIACFLIEILDCYESDSEFLKPEELSRISYKIIKRN